MTYRMKRAALKRGGARLREWLKSRGKNQDWLAAEIGTHQTNVSAWILGRPIPLDMALAIRKATRIPVEDWVTPAEESGATLPDVKSA